MLYSFYGGIVELVNTSALQAEDFGFEPRYRHQIEPILISNVNFGNLKVNSLAKLKILNIISYNIIYGPDR